METVGRITFVTTNDIIEYFVIMVHLPISNINQMRGAHTAVDAGAGVLDVGSS